MNAPVTIAPRVRPELLNSLRELAALGVRVGGECAIGARFIEAALGTNKQARLAQRDREIVELREAWFGESSGNEAAGKIAEALARYEATGWRSDRALSAPPPSAIGTPRQFYFRILKAGDIPVRGPRRQTIAPAKDRIRQVLRGPVNQTAISVISQTRESRLGERSRTRSRVNAIPKNFQAIVEALPGFKAAEEKARIAEHEARRQHLTEIARLDNEAAARWAPQEAAKAKAVEKVRAAEVALRAANDELARVSGAVASERFAFEAERRRHEEALLAGDWPELDAFRERAERALVAAKAAAEHRQFVVRNTVTGKTKTVDVGNGSSVKARVLAIYATLQTLGELRLVADRRELPAKLEEIAASWPKIEPPHREDAA